MKWQPLKDAEKGYYYWVKGIDFGFDIVFHGETIRTMDNSDINHIDIENDWAYGPLPLPRNSRFDDDGNFIIRPEDV